MGFPSNGMRRCRRCVPKCCVHAWLLLLACESYTTRKEEGVVPTDFLLVCLCFLFVFVPPPLERGVPGGVNISVRLVTSVNYCRSPSSLSVCLSCFQAES
ncbi:unnamed protein product [Ectocarpus sp. 13 AM-2016]